MSLAPFDYLHGIYENVGIVWIDAHPDVSTRKDGYPNAHAMVLGSLMGDGAEQLSGLMKNRAFSADEILYVGLQPLHDYFVSDEEIRAFAERFDHILIHFDIDVLDEHLFHSTYFADSELVGDGSGGGKMTVERAGEILRLIGENADVAGLTIAEYLPFDEYRLHKMFSGIKLLTM